MVAKAFLILFGSVLLVQNISANCIGYGGGLANSLARAELGAEIAGARLVGAELAGARLPGAGYGMPAFATSGGSFTVTSTSPIAPTGITIISENTIEGPLEVAGELPVLATVAVEGQFPSNGAAGTIYGCGNGEVGISQESLAAAGIGAELAGSLARAEIPGAGIAAVNRRSRPCGSSY